MKVKHPANKIEHMYNTRKSEKSDQIVEYYCMTCRKVLTELKKGGALTDTIRLILRTLRADHEKRGKR